MNELKTLTLQTEKFDSFPDLTARESLKKALENPATPPTAAGKVLRVLAVNEDGTFTCEWADVPSGGVTDVTVDGKSIVTDGVAVLPLCASGVYGVVKTESGYPATSGIQIMGGGHLSIIPGTPGRRYANYPVTESNYDDFLKKAMSDGIAKSWTDTERLAALLRMGCTVDDNGFVKWTEQEATE